MTANVSRALHVVHFQARGGISARAGSHAAVLPPRPGRTWNSGETSVKAAASPQTFLGRRGSQQPATACRVSPELEFVHEQAGNHEPQLPWRYELVSRRQAVSWSRTAR